MVNIIVMGSPGSGKGTYCEKKVEEGYRVIALGRKLREEVAVGSDLGKRIKQNIDQGILIEDELAFSLIRYELNKVSGPFVMEGFPSTVPQYVMLYDFLKEANRIDTVHFVYLRCAQNVALERIKSRMICKNCERIYNRVSKPPKQENTCDFCEKVLYVRPEDEEKTALPRIKTFYEKTFPILALAEQHFKLEGMGH